MDNTIPNFLEFIENLRASLSIVFPQECVKRNVIMLGGGGGGGGGGGVGGP